MPKIPAFSNSLRPKSAKDHFCRNQNQIKMSFEEMPELLTIKEATQILNVHPNTLRNWEKEGLINVIRIGPRRDRRYDKQLIRKMAH